jgi:uncharacterized YccA/Bax inhibitor family protein
VRQSSNPVFRSLQPQQSGGHAQFGTGIAGAQQMGYQAQPYATYPPQTGVSRPMTLDDVVTKTGITLGVLSVVGVVSYLMVSANVGLAMPFAAVGGLGGFALVMIATFGRKQDNPAIVLSYAALEGLFLGAISFLLANFTVQGANAGSLIAQAILGTVGVFFGMLVVYKTGAIRVTPKFTRALVAIMIGAVVMMLGNMLFSMFSSHDGGPLRNGGTVAIIFSLVMIVIAALSFLTDFDSADQMIRAGAPEKAAWGIALGLTVTLVWLYLEILRLLSYFRGDN